MLIALRSTFCTEPFQRHFRVMNHETDRQIPGSAKWHIDIEYGAARFALEMAVILEIRAVACRSPVQVHLFHNTPAHQRFETVVNRRKRNGWHPPFRTQKYLGSSWVIPFLH